MVLEVAVEVLGDEEGAGEVQVLVEDLARVLVEEVEVLSLAGQEVDAGDAVDLGEQRPTR